VKRGNETKEVTIKGVADAKWPADDRGLVFQADFRTQKATDVGDALNLGLQHCRELARHVVIELGQMRIECRCEIIEGRDDPAIGGPLRRLPQYGGTVLTEEVAVQPARNRQVIYLDGALRLDFCSNGLPGEIGNSGSSLKSVRGGAAHFGSRQHRRAGLGCWDLGRSDPAARLVSSGIARLPQVTEQSRLVNARIAGASARPVQQRAGLSKAALLELRVTSSRGRTCAHFWEVFARSRHHGA
jgi:hypothetical protein